MIHFYHIQPLVDAVLRYTDQVNVGPGARKATTQDAIDSITKLIEDNVDTENWKDNGGASGSLRVFNDVLIITALPGTQKKVDDLLKRLKQETVTKNLPSTDR